MNALFLAMAKPPADALKPIGFGNLKGKSDINPQWRIEALTEVYGLYGEGWYYKIIDKNYQEVPATGEKMIFITVELYTKNTDTNEWRMPAIGCGGDFLIIKDKNGIHGNDEAEAMCLTDALGKAAKNLGIANDIYRGKYDSKYGWRDEHEAMIQEQQKKADRDESWRLQGGSVSIKAADGKFYDIDRLSKRQLEKALTDERFTGIKDFIEAEIAKK